MFRLDGLGKLQRIKWSHLKPGMIVISGVSINDSSIPELLNFPVLTKNLIYTLQTKYQFLRNRDVLAAEALYNFNPSDLTAQINEAENNRKTFNSLREEFAAGKKLIVREHEPSIDYSLPFSETDFVEQDFLLRDSYNSFSYMYGLDDDRSSVPSYLSDIDLSLSFADLFTGRLKSKFNLPEDKDVLLHIVIDFSKSMDSCGKLGIVLDTVAYFSDFYSKMAPGTRFKFYAFSDECRPVDFPVSASGISRGNTSYSAFMKKVLRFREPDIHNKILLFTDGLPTDLNDALHTAAFLKKNKVDYTQLIFDIREEQRNQIQFRDGKGYAVDNVVDELTKDMLQITLSDDELDNKMKQVFSDFTGIAAACGGNQIIMRINSLLKIVSVECYDRYLGLLSLAEDR